MKKTEASIFAYKGVIPKIEETAFVAHGACIVGDVHLGENVNIWFNAVLRGDVNYIRIWENTNIQDGAICHVTTDKFPLIVGKDVTVGHGAILHGCTIEDACLIGMGAIIMDDAVVEKGAIVAAGAVVTPRTVVKQGEVWAGAPAEKMRDIKTQEAEYLLWSAPHYVKLAKTYQQSDVHKLASV